VNLFEPHTARPLGIARIVFGVAAMLKGWNMREVFGPLVGPEPLHIPYWAVLPSPGFELAFVLFVVWLSAAALFTVGWGTKWAGSVLTLTVGVSFVLDQQIYANHLYLLLITSLLLTVTDSGSAYALDSRRTGGRSTVEAWQPLLLRAQLTIVYGFAAVAKLNSVYLSSEVLRVYVRHLGPYGFPEAWREPTVLVPLAVLSIAAEGFLAAGLWWRRTRLAAVAIGVLFHAAIVATMTARVPLLIFGLTMFALYAAFYTRPVTPSAQVSGRSRASSRAHR
jgi:hypothetical protein